MPLIKLKCKSSIIRSSLCDYSDAYIKTIAIPNAAAANNSNKRIIFKNGVLCTNCISEINNTGADDTYDIDVVIPMYNLIQYSKIIRKYQEVYGNTIKMNQLLKKMTILLIFLLKIVIIILCLNQTG